MSATRQAIASSVARATCGGREPPVVPPRPPARRAATRGLRARRAPAARAPRRHPRPALARPAKAAGSGASPRSRERYSSSAPAVNTPPSSAHSTSPFDPPGHGRQQPARSRPAAPCRRWRARTRRCRRWPWCGPARRSPRRRARPAGPGTARAAAARRGHDGWRRVPRSPAVSAISRQHLPRHAEDLQQLGRPTRAPRAACARRSRDPWQKPAPRRSHRNESTVPIRSVPAPRGRVATPSSCSSSHASFPAEKYGSSGRPLSSWIRSAIPACSSRSSTSWERLSCHVTTGVSARPVSASQASTDSPWWSSPQATTSPGASVNTSATASTTAVDDVLGVLLHPARPGMLQRLLAPRLAQRLEIRVEEDRLHGRGALVDAEQQAHRDLCSAALRHHGTGDRGGARRLERSLSPEGDAEPLHQAADVLRDPEGCGQAGGADRRDVDEAGGTPARARSDS